MTALFEFPDEMLSQHLAIVGKAGSGKTYTSKGMVERLLNARRRVCILDPTGVWWGLRSSADGKRVGFPVVVFGGAHADVQIGEHSGAALAKIVADKNLPAIVDLSEMLIGQRHRFATEFAEALYRDNRAPLHLVIDEADEFCPQNPLPETKRMLHHFDRIVRRGRVRGFRVMLITQRPAVLHKNVLTQANTLIAMRLTAPQDRNAIKAWVEGQADVARGKAVLESIAQLPRGEGWVWAPELGFLERVPFPQIATFDSSRTPDDDEVIAEPTKLAAVDLTEITASFAAVQAEAATVKELQAELTKLRRQLANLPVPSVTLGVSEDAIQRRIDDAVRAARSQTPAPSLPVATLRAVANAIAALQAIEAGSVALAPAPAPARLAISAPPREPAAPSPALGPVHSGVTAPQQRILDALARLHSLDVNAPNKATVAAMAGVSSKSSGFANNLGAMRGRNWIDYPAGGCVALTGGGAALANRPDKPPTRGEVHDAWLAMVTRPQAALLQVLIGCYPRALHKGDLASEAGVSAASSGFANNLGSLRSLGAINYPTPGHVAATALLFPKG